MNYQNSVETQHYSPLPLSYIDENILLGRSVLEQIKRGSLKHRRTKSQQDRVKGVGSGWQVHKFGGSSFGNPDCYSFVAGLVDSFVGKNLIVVSAMSGITNALYAVCERARDAHCTTSMEWGSLVNRITNAINVRLGDSNVAVKQIQRLEVDLVYLSQVLSYMSSASLEDQNHITSLVVGYGEIWSARLLTSILRQDHGRSAAFMDARDVLVVRPLEPGSDDIEVCWDVTRAKLKTWWMGRKACDVLVVTGFVARTLEDDLPTTLKRNGSDFSATIFSVLSKAQSVTVWKDVDGMYTADPKKNPNAVFIPYQTFEEAEEASLRGAFVLQKDCIAPAREKNIPIFLRNAFNLSCPGTRIGPPEDHSRSDDDEPVFCMEEMEYGELDF